MIVGEPVAASVQYNDLTGTIALDGYSGSFLHELRSRAEPAFPPGYHAVGLEFGAIEPGRADPTIWMTLLAASDVDVNTINLTERNRTVPVVAFNVAAVPFSELVALIKRCVVVVSDRGLGRTPTMILREDRTRR